MIAFLATALLFLIGTWFTTHYGREDNLGYDSQIKAYIKLSKTLTGLIYEMLDEDKVIGGLQSLWADVDTKIGREDNDGIFHKVIVSDIRYILDLAVAWHVHEHNIRGLENKSTVFETSEEVMRRKALIHSKSEISTDFYCGIGTILRRHRPSKYRKKRDNFAQYFVQLKFPWIVNKK